MLVDWIFFSLQSSQACTMSVWEQTQPRKQNMCSVSGHRPLSLEIYFQKSLWVQ